MEITRSPFNTKTILTGSIMSILLTVMAQFSVNIVHDSYLAIDHMPAGGIFIFFLLAILINPLLRFFSRDKVSFSATELLVIYTMVLVTASVAEMGLGCQFLPILAAPSYYATPQNQWAELILPHIKPWMMPKDISVTAPFFEGLPKGAPIPWGAWALPIFSWGIFLMALYFVTICAVSILRKEWVERERLSFPLAQLPVAMVQAGRGRIPNLFKSKIFWLGFVIPVVFSSLLALHRYFPIVPIPNLYTRVPVFRQTMDLIFRLSFPILGFSYLINLDVAFSVWFFNLIFLVFKGWMNITGVSSPENVGIYGAAGNPILANIGTGSFIVFVLFSLFLERRHLKEVFRKAIGRGGEIDDSKEIVSYKTAFWGLIIGLLFLLGWLAAAGMSIWVALFFLAGAFVFWIGLTRVVAESGLATLVGPSISSAQVVSGFGSKVVGPESLPQLGVTYIYSSDIRTFPASSVMHSEKIAEKFGKVSLRPMLWVMLLAIFIGLAVSTIVIMKLAYTKGGINLDDWYFIGGPQAPYNWVTDHLKNPITFSKLGWVCRIAGAVIMFTLMFLRNRLIWWPLHPLGFTVGMVWLVDNLWFSIFLAWFIKTLLLRYGGPKAYENGKPFFFGLILGQYSAAVIWCFINFLTHTTKNGVFWI
ncbi:MAG: hypothetical protein NTY10_04110 [Candidatus Omnitrophica bacterium]|nr:hypothetical protein [Candidatus Omnitrophota bacterium]